MTPDTTDPRIATVSSAIKDTVGLITNVIPAALHWHEEGFFKTHVARTTEFLCQVVRIHVRRIKYFQVPKVFFLDGRNVFLARPMTTFTSHSGYQVIEL